MSFQNNDLKYQQEKAKRKQLEDENDNKILNKIADIIRNDVDFHGAVNFIRYDKEWFAKISPNTTSWIRGCPDFRIEAKDNSSLYLFIELKVKDMEYRKTVSGGLTKQGTSIPAYGCPSYYLDKIPVWKNMNTFCSKTGIPAKSFLIVFAKPDASEINCISLESINRMESSGQWQHPITNDFMPFMKNYKEGYGQECFLIPKLKTKSLLKDDFFLKHWKQIALSNAISPEETILCEIETVPKKSGLKLNK